MKSKAPLSRGKNENYIQLLRLPISKHLILYTCNYICWNAKDLHFLKPRANQSQGLNFLTLKCDSISNVSSMYKIPIPYNGNTKYFLNEKSHKNIFVLTHMPNYNTIY